MLGSYGIGTARKTKKIEIYPEDTYELFSDLVRKRISCSLRYCFIAFEQVNNEFGEVLFAELELESNSILVQCDETFEKLCRAAEKAFESQLDVELKKLTFHIRSALTPESSYFHKKLHSALTAHQIPSDEDESSQ